MSREEFRERCVERDGGQCLIPWCTSEVTVDPDGPGEIHHTLERELWPDGGYIPNNGACVCNDHHRMAEKNEIPPQAFWRWAGIEEPALPANMLDVDFNVDDAPRVTGVNKWGMRFETPPHDHLREYPKYPSTRHLLPLYWQSERGTAGERTGRDDTGLTSVDSFLDIPLVVTVKIDGSNTMLVKDSDEPVRARNGRDAEHRSFNHLKNEYWDRNVYENLPEYLQVFGENMYAKHSIHYASYCPCEGNELPCECTERDCAPPVEDVFLVFGVYDTRYNLWLSWPETEEIAHRIGFPTVPSAGGHELNPPTEREDPGGYYAGTYDNEQDLVQYLLDRGERTVDKGHEGIIVRSMYPFHYGQFKEKVGKYVRPNHVQTDEHWSHQEIVRNSVKQEE